MRVLGINAILHDPSAALLIDGRVVAAAEGGSGGGRRAVQPAQARRASGAAFGVGTARPGGRLGFLRSGDEYKALAGGVALNCVANARLAEWGPFDRVWIQPAAGDAGTALGAALHWLRGWWRFRGARPWL
jgi:hypothetical protein